MARIDAWSRRSFLVAVPGTVALTPAIVRAAERAGSSPSGEQAGARADALHAGFPAQDPARVRQMVGVSHFSLERVEALLAEEPELAKATWDWGFGDWESALGAASHTGNREIALVLLEHGARMNIFTAAMLGHTELVRAFIESAPGIQRTTGPHGFSVMHHARVGGEASRETLEYLRGVEGADASPVNVDLPEGERERYVGRYRFAPGPEGILEVGYSERFGMLTLVRAPDGVSRNLVHHGGHAFSPVGAPRVRIVFAMDGGGEGARAGGMSIAAPRPVASATREG